MAVTRELLRGLKLDEEQVSAIIEAHKETVDGLKNVNASIQSKLDEAKDKIKALKDEGWEEKYNNLNKEYETYKAEQAEKMLVQAKEKAYVDLLRKAGVSEKRIDGILKYDHAKIEAEELDESGSYKNEKGITEAIKSEWADFITKSGTQGASVENPPATGGNAFDSMPLAEKMAYANEHPEAPEVTAWLNK